jgi:citrate synthase
MNVAPASADDIVIPALPFVAPTATGEPLVVEHPAEQELLHPQTVGQATVNVDGKQAELPVLKPVEGYSGIGVESLLRATGKVTFDPGYMNTAAVTSAITYIDGEASILRYRGYPIEQLAANSSFLEVAFLLIYGDLPTASELNSFRDQVNRHTLVPENYRSFLNSFPKGGHPMSLMASAMSALGTFYPDSLNPHSDKAVDLATVLILAKIRTITSYVYRASNSQALMYPDSMRGYVQDFLRMCFAAPYEHYDVDPAVVNALDKLFILHADHEQNCSTSTVRLVGSANASVYASVAAGIGALSGPLHGGANEAVLEMLDGIAAGTETVKSFMEKVKKKEPGVRLMGFGHRVYKSYDPRAKIVKAHADAVLHSLGVNDELFDVARELEEIALSDEYFISRRLYPNVDFYTGLIYRAIGFPPAMFTPLFALGRMPGWIAQWREMIRDPETRIGRPRQLYVGERERNYVPINERIPQS